MFKPYDLVHVKMPNFRCVGEVISKETPDKTYMVRLVPNDPSTMVELSVDQLTKTKNKYRFVHYALVFPSLLISKNRPFPVDMLRYEFAAPANFDLVQKYDDATWDYVLFPQLKPNHQGSFCIGEASVSKMVSWDYNRWASFGWTVKHLKTLEIVSAS